MSIDKLQERIRKLKNPSVVDFTATQDMLPPQLLAEQVDFVKAYGKFCLDLLEGLKGIVPAVRFRFGMSALLGPDGLNLLTYLLNRAGEMGFYVLLDSVEAFSKEDAQRAAQALAQWPCDGLVISAYAGSDCIKPYIPLLKDSGKSVFVVIRTANKTAPELQDLMTGSRLVYMAAADTVKRLGESTVSRRGYAQIAGVGPANSADCLRSLRGKYKELFLLVDGYDYSNANAKNCSLAFDQLGHGAAVCASSSVISAWQTDENVDNTYVDSAVQAAIRMKKNITKYVTIL